MVKFCDAFDSCIAPVDLFIHSASQAKIPDIEKCLDIVATLQAKKNAGEVRFLYVHTSLNLA